MFLSFIIPMYNVEKFIERCILSCEDQNLEKDDFELIVINDGSRDNSLEVAQKLQQKYSNITLYSQENAGLSAARNFGMSKAKGDYLWFVDSDDWIKSNCLGELKRRVLNQSTDVVEIMAVDVLEKQERLYYQLEDNKYMTGPESLLEMIMPCAPFYIWKKSFLIKNNLEFYRGIFHEDMEFTPRALYLAKNVSTIKDVLYYVYQNPNSITRSINPKKSFDYICHVCESLKNFSLNIDAHSNKIKINYFIAMCINNALENIMDADNLNKRKLLKEIRKRKYLLTALKESNNSKYYKEYYIFKFSPFDIITTYSIIHKFIYK